MPALANLSEKTLSYAATTLLRHRLKIRVVQGDRAIERYWRKTPCSRSWAGRHLTWDAFNQIKERTPLSRPKSKLHLPYRALQSLAVL